MAELTLEQLRGVKGLGESKVQRLIEHFGGLDQVAEASADELASIQGVGKGTAAQIHAIARGEALPEPEPNGEKPRRAPRKAAEARPKQARPAKTETPVVEDGENVISDIAISADTLVLRDGRGKAQKFKLARPSLVLDFHEQTRQAARSFAESLQL